MASFTTPRPFSFHAGADIGQCRFVKFGANEQTVVVAGAGEAAIGISMDNVKLGEDLAVALTGGGYKLKLAGTVARGARIAAGAGGAGVAGAEGDAVGAIAMADGVAGDVIPVEIVA